MYKTLRISFSLKNTYRVNSILFAIKQIPLIKKILPDALYGVRGLKIFANIISVIWEVISVFLGKFLYFITMVCGIGVSCTKNVPEDQTFLHILLFLTVIGAYMNTSLFNPTRDKYYAMIQLRMNAREYTLVNYGYMILKVIMGFLPFSLLFGIQRGVPVWFCILIPFAVAGIKAAVAAYSLWDYERSGYVYNENKIRKHLWIFAAVLLALAYGLPAAGDRTSCRCIHGCDGTVYPGRDHQRPQDHILWALPGSKPGAARSGRQSDGYNEAGGKDSERQIHLCGMRPLQVSAAVFEYLNELFIKRHRKILWKSAVRLAGICLVLSCAAASRPDAGTGGEKGDQ